MKRAKWRLLSLLLVCAMMIGLLPASALAADDPETVPAVYVSANGSDTEGAGTFEKPYATLVRAVGAAQDGATIRVMTDLTINELVRVTDKHLTITSLDEEEPVTLIRGSVHHTGRRRSAERLWRNVSGLRYHECPHYNEGRF